MIDAVTALSPNPSPKGERGIKIFVINLARDAARRAHMESLLPARGLSAEFVPAVDGKNLSAAERAAYDPDLSARYYGGPMSDNEIACYLSHYKIYERMVREDIPAALILEDDIEIDVRLPIILDALLADPFQEWQVARLQSARGKIVNPSAPKFAGQCVALLPEDCGLYQLRTHVLGACGYVIKLAGARTMVEYGRRIFMPVDHTMDRYWENGIVPFVVRPFLVRQHDDFPSIIGDRSVKQRDLLPPPVRRRHRRQRMLDGVRKRLFWVIH